ncbi:MAG TPA: PfkB family carbohydrate kinase [Ktedonobacterales bacterium]|nr:PfkB family carbohydrate kinase [Ktedonobacterales bacterium]
MAVEDETPDLLLIGHASRDLLPSGEWRLGGTVTYAAAAARQMELRAAIVTSAPSDVGAALRAEADDTPVAVVPAAEATTFENIYSGSQRRQLLRGHAEPLGLEHVPEGWRAAPVVLLAPVAGEIAPKLARAFPDALVAATAQGWLRRWDADGQVYPGSLKELEEALPALRALILSQEDLLPPPGVSPALGMPRTPEEADALIGRWARRVPLLVVTRGPEGALLYVNGEGPVAYPGVPAREVDPTGAGDVFAAAFLAALGEGADPGAAVTFANRVAARSVEAAGTGSIPTRAEVPPISGAG